MLSSGPDTKQESVLGQNSATDFRMAVSAQAKVTGDRADSIFVDDVLDADDAYSQPARDATSG